MTRNGDGTEKLVTAAAKHREQRLARPSRTSAGTRCIQGMQADCS